VRAALLKSILPTLAFKLFLMLVPMLLRWSERNVAGLPSKSAVDFGVGRKYFLFQLIVVWLFSTVIGIMLVETPKIRGFKSSGVPLYDLGKILSSNPRLVRVWLARSIPQQVRPRTTCTSHSSLQDCCSKLAVCTVMDLLARGDTSTPPCCKAATLCRRPSS